MTTELPTTSESLWNVKDLAKYLRTTTHAIYKLVERGQVPCIRIGKSIRFDPAEIREWVKSKSCPITPPDGKETH